MGSRHAPLDRRSRDVLSSIVVAHIRSAAPVSSRELTRGGAFRLSPASIRNAMAELEELGFLSHPHVSAGRVPTDLGYRTFVEELMTAETPSDEERREIALGLDAEPVDVDRFLHATSRLLSRLTGEVAVVSAPARRAARNAGAGASRSVRRRPSRRPPWTKRRRAAAFA